MKITTRDDPVPAKRHPRATDPDAEQAFIEAVEEGRRDLREGRTLSHEEVVARFRSCRKTAK